MQGIPVRAVLTMMTGAGVLLGGAGIADAQVHFALETGATTSLGLSFNQFDPSLGTLTAVDITLANSTTQGGGATAHITGGEGGNSATESWTGTLDITAPGAFTAFSEPTSAFATCTVPSAGAGCLVGNPQDDPTFTPNPVTDSTDLGAFVGLGTVDLTAAIDNPLDGSSATIQSGTNLSSGGLAWSGDVSLTYEYTSAVPEPASLSLFGISVAGVGFLRRRRNG